MCAHFGTRIFGHLFRISPRFNLRDLNGRMYELGAHALRVWAGVRRGGARVCPVVVLKRMVNHSSDRY